jgi:hypothetical protein
MPTTGECKTVSLQMNAHDQEPPTVGTHVEMLRPRDSGSSASESFERAVVVGSLMDPGLGVVLELQFGDTVRVQRVWPSPGIHLREVAAATP